MILRATTDFYQVVFYKSLHVKFLSFVISSEDQGFNKNKIKDQKNVKLCTITKIPTTKK